MAALFAGGLLVAARGQAEWQEIVKLDFGTCEAALTNIENQVSLAKPDQHGVLEAKLLAILGDGAATMPAKQFACRMLRVVGSEKSVAPLAKLLGDEQLSHAARYALEAIGGDATDAALRDALAKTSGKARIGIIGSLGARGDRKAVPALAKLLKADDAATAIAALKALGHIGGTKVASVWTSVSLSKTVETEYFEAVFRTTESIAKAGDLAAAKKMYEELLNDRASKQVRVDPKGEAARVVAALKGDDPVLGQAALPALLALEPKAAAKALTKELPALPAEKKIIALRALSALQGVKPLGEALNACFADANPAVQLAAVEAAVQLGDAQNIAALVAKLADDGDLGKAAKQSLTDIQGAGTVAELVKAAGAGDQKIRVTVLAILADRRDPAVLPALYKLSSDENQKVRRATVKAISALGGATDVEKLVGMLLASKDGGDRDSFASAVSSIAARQPVVETRAFHVIEGVGKADDGGKVLLLGVLSALGGKPAFEASRGCLASTVPEVKKAAVKALAEWPDAAPLDDLKNVVKTAASDVNRILAMRGYIRLLAVSNVKNNKRVEAYKEMYALAMRPQEKRAVFAGLADAPSVQVLEFLAGHLADADVKAEAQVTYLKIAEELIKPKKNEAKAALEKLLAITDDKNLRKRAENALKRIK
jgi:HEAT repeat protein